MVQFKAFRIVNGKPRNVIVDENGKVINRTPAKDELRELEKEPRTPQDTRKHIIYTDEELLDYLREFYIKYKIPPSTKDFANNYPYYPSYTTYLTRFGNWANALKLVGLDIDSRILNGFMKKTERGRLGELLVKNHFEKNPIDLSGSNYRSPYDGICPNGMIYDVKSSKLYSHTHWNKYWKFQIHNKCKEDIEYFYLLAFDEDYKKLLYVWRVPGEIIEKNDFRVSMNSWSYGKFSVENLEQYDITDKLKFF